MGELGHRRIQGSNLRRANVGEPILVLGHGSVDKEGDLHFVEPALVNNDHVSIVLMVPLLWFPPPVVLRMSVRGLRIPGEELTLVDDISPGPQPAAKANISED